MSDAAEFVPVAEAVRRLGISDRQVRRYATRLPAEDKQEHRTGLRVRYGALVALRGTDEAEQASGSDRPGQAKPTPMAGPGGANEANGALIEHLQDEVAYLREALAREQENVRSARFEIAEERKRADLLIAAMATGRVLIPAGGQLADDADTGTEIGVGQAGPMATPSEAKPTPEAPAVPQNRPETGESAEEDKLPADPYTNTDTSLYANTGAAMEDREDADPYANAANTVSTAPAEETPHNSPPVATDEAHDDTPRERAAASARALGAALDRQAAQGEREKRRNRPSLWDRLRGRG